MAGNGRVRSAAFTQVLQDSILLPRSFGSCRAKPVHHAQERADSAGRAP